MNRRIPLFVTFGIIAVVALLAFMYYAAFKPTTRFFQKDNIELRGRINEGSARYGVINIGTPQLPYDGSLGLSFRCGDTELHVDRSPVEKFIEMADEVSSANDDYQQSWPKDALDLKFCRGTQSRSSFIRLIVSGEQVQHISSYAASGRSPKISIRGGGADRWIPLPFRDAEAEELFGKPHRVFELFVH